MKKRQVVALAFDRLCTFEFGCVVEIFALDRPELNVPWYDFRVCSLDKPPLRAAGGILVEAEYGLAPLQQADLIVLPGWRDTDEPAPPELCEALRAAHARGAQFATICNGVFLLAEAGLLDGRRATTHWRYMDRLIARYPQIKVEPDCLYVEDGEFLMSAGSAAGLDMLLHLVRKDYGAQVANQVARRLVLPPHREGGQAQFVSRPLPRFDNNKLSALLDWLQANLQQAHTLESLAGRVAMSPRTLLRQFKGATGASPYDWLLGARVDLAKTLLEQGRMNLQQIADACGFGAVETLRHHFRQRVGVSPAHYRQQFTTTA
ncbi:AraC family transcriptional regulator, transcriptional activator FtrA [Andreprevotia lacus DSM 23236]|uniref:AraC family transcriptional regulator, transcriptional activator FtrA n=1 Tax=Andreprevotia lacus DSM 23236 TaxID=1121001 RepID=A0A1W1Y0N7_9NEIS|nr:transcriptional regulator FtrA [Andreprevotia lacus]SMC29694.1 AraC family transcriptional regulator, transcriptional activator FtrA [Andreprevotia lacus DSM 23236]